MKLCIVWMNTIIHDSEIKTGHRNKDWYDWCLLLAAIEQEKSKQKWKEKNWKDDEITENYKLFSLHWNYSRMWTTLNAKAQSKSQAWNIKIK